MVRWFAFLVAVIFLLPAAAQASSVSVEYNPGDPFQNNDFYTLVVYGDPGENQVRVEPAVFGLRVSDESQPLTAAEGCNQDGDHAAICEIVEPYGGVDMALGDGDDKVLGLAGGPANIRGEAGKDTLIGTLGNDVLDGGGDADEISGLGGNDTVTGGAGGDILDGGPGTDRLSYSGRTDPITVDLESQTSQGDGDSIAGFEDVTGGDGADHLKGSGEANKLDGAGGDDDLEGAGGDDVLTGGTGRNALDGAAGGDAIDESWTSENLEVRLALGVAGNAHFSDTISGIENVRTGAGADLVFGDDSANDISTGAGNDYVRGGGGDDTVGTGDGSDTLEGEQGNDRLDAGDGGDLLSGGAGDDTLLPGKNHYYLFDRGDLSDGDGDDHMDGGAGTDVVDYSDRFHDVVVDLAAGIAGEPASEFAPEEHDLVERAENVSSGSGADLVRSAAGPNAIATGAGADRVEAADGDRDSVTCGEGADSAALDMADSATDCETQTRIVPSPGEQGPPPGTNGDGGGGTCLQTAAGCPPTAPTATAGDDILSGDDLPNLICGLAGNDEISGAGGNDTIYGDACNDKQKPAAGTATGRDGNDTLNGGKGNDSLYGAGGNDKLYGGKGNDRLVGGGGNDKLTGGPGANQYSAGAGNDTITARNGKKETVDCGKGKKDKATVDKNDKTKGCEKVKRARGVPRGVSVRSLAARADRGGRT